MSFGKLSGPSGISNWATQALRNLETRFGLTDATGLRDTQAPNAAGDKSTANDRNIADEWNAAVPPDGTRATRSSLLPPDSAVPPNIALQLKQQPVGRGEPPTAQPTQNDGADGADGADTENRVQQGLQDIQQGNVQQGVQEILAALIAMIEQMQQQQGAGGSSGGGGAAQGVAGPSGGGGAAQGAAGPSGGGGAAQGASGPSGGGGAAQGASGTSSSAGAQPMSSGEQAQAQQIYQYLLSKGLSPAQAAGVLGNMQTESSLNTGATNAAEGAIGLCQWEGGRRTALEQFAAAQGKPVTDWKTQVDFMMSELQGSESGAFNALKSATTPAEAAAAFDQYYERSAGTSRDERIANANNMAAQMG